MNIGIIGMGVVGKATAHVLKKVHSILPYDKYNAPYDNESSLDEIAKESDATFLCVPTPMKSSGAIDYSAIHNSLDYFSQRTSFCCRKLENHLIVVRSTATSGTTDNLSERYNFRFAFNPEFLTERNSFEDAENTDRVVIGSNNEQDYNLVESIYRPVFPNAKYINVNRKTAEMIKYASNVTLAGQIALANELFQICKVMGVSWETVRKAIILDKRIGAYTEVPGHDGDLGFGGKCFPKDLNALIYLARDHMYRPYLLEEIWRLNEKVRKDKDWLEIEGVTNIKND